MNKIVIIGAGPAGATTSLFLSKAKIPHILIDKAVFPRDKICGDGLTPKPLHVLKKWNPNIVDKIVTQPDKFLPCWGGIVFSPQGDSVPVNFQKTTDPTAPVFIAKRWEFDNFLIEQLDHEYAETIWGAEVTKIEKKGNDYHIEYKKDDTLFSLVTPLIVGADGDRSIVKKTLAPRENDPYHYGVALRAYYKGVKGLHPKNFMEFYILDVIPGYLWIFPLPNGEVNVGIGTLTAVFDEATDKINLRNTLLQLLAENPLFKDRFADAELNGKIQGWGLPMASKPNKMSGDGWMLLGDAASLIDPVSGEGIGNAMYTGWLAAEAAEKAIAANNFSQSFLHIEYEKRFYRCLGKDMRLSKLMQNLYKYPKLINYFLRKAQTNKLLMETASCIFDDESVRERLYKPSFYFKALIGFFK